VPFDRHTGHIEQIYQAGLIVPPLDLPKKDPIPAAVFDKLKVDQNGEKWRLKS